MFESLQNWSILCHHSLSIPPKKINKPLIFTDMKWVNKTEMNKTTGCEKFDFKITNFYTGCPANKYIQLWRSISNVFFQQGSSKIYKYNIQLECNFTKNSVIFGKFNVYFTQKTQNKASMLKLYLAIFILLPEVYLGPF